MSHAIPEMLLSIQAVAFNTETPFRFTSGLLSPIYCDNRLVISYPEKRLQLIQAFLKLINDKHLGADVVAGVATAGIAHAAWIAEQLNKPMIYVRSEAKSHGKKNQIEGVLKKGQRVVVVEDLISTGKSSIKAAQAVQEAGGEVSAVIAIFSYQLPAAMENFKQANLNLHTLTNLSELIQVAQQAGYIKSNEEMALREWQKKLTSGEITL